MIRLPIFLVFLLGSITCCFSQEDAVKVVDSLYKEDQFYAGVTYNLIGKKPDNLSQRGFSLGFHLGFIKDMPINKARNVAIGIGLGYSANSYNQNLLINKDDTNNFTYSIIENSNSYTKNKFSNHLIELPIEFRWRSSTPTDYNFWRIYTGFKFGYVLTHTTKYKGDLGSINYSNNEDFNKLQYGLTMSAGYNTWNIYLYYGLNPIFSKEAQINASSIDMNAVKIGLMFYIL
ncbi:Outer membrane protein beta-barrel domain-containing protein [Flaviramulus basaltis]|uniref:Outer membrane protein beta-barrel domain-containing protein n=1 Tax=Flaviramulus basaltis TaxID=369401 RepID=A0A1K2IE73_9FLAO|nr:porin family protein [Flaviramulus basaltis]SFZ90679.1 Outer membrane protein beta-barrel domain-containing protein [Flaviramulus basaltis]